MIYGLHRRTPRSFIKGLLGHCHASQYGYGSLKIEGPETVLGTEINTIPFATALPTQTKVQSGAYYSKSGTPLNLKNSGESKRCNIVRFRGSTLASRGWGGGVSNNGLPPCSLGCRRSHIETLSIDKLSLRKLTPKKDLY